MTWRPPPTVFIDRQALEVITAESSAAPRGSETGGILLGWGDNSPDFHVMRAGTPGPQAIHEVDRFLRDLDHATKLAAQAWQDLNAVWIGEWHTHPDAALTPSPADLASYQRHLDDPDLNFSRFLSIIVKADIGSTVLAAWVLEAGGAVLSPIVVQQEGDGLT